MGRMTVTVSSSLFPSATGEVLIYCKAIYLLTNQIPPNPAYGCCAKLMLHSVSGFPLERQILQELLHEPCLVIC